MRQVTLHIPDKKYTFFLELAKSLDFVKKIEEDTAISDSKKQTLKGIKEAVEEVKLIKAGKMKGINAKDLLNEL